MAENPKTEIKVMLIGCSPKGLPDSLLRRIAEATEGLEVIVIAKDEVPDCMVDIINPNRIQKLIVSSVMEIPTINQDTPRPRLYGKVSDLYPKSKKRDNRFITNKRRSR